MDKNLDFDVLLDFEDDRVHELPGDRELELVASFLPDILKELLMLQALNQED